MMKRTCGEICEHNILAVYIVKYSNYFLVSSEFDVMRDHVHR